MKLILSHLLFFVAFSLLIPGCSSSPKRIDGGSVDQAKYDKDDLYCRSQVKENYPIVEGQLGSGEFPRSGGMAMALTEYDNCMEEQGWKSN
jgi:hypothetical protein